MALFGQFLLSIMERAERESAARDRDRGAVFVGKNHFLAPIMRPVFLRFEIVLKFAADRTHKPIEPAVPPFVDVAFSRAVPVILEFLERPVRKEPHAEARQEREHREFLHLKIDQDLSTARDLVMCFHVGKFLHRHRGDRKRAVDDRFSIRDGRSGGTRSHERPVVAGFLPFPPDHAVIVGRRPPDVYRHRRRQE